MNKIYIAEIAGYEILVLQENDINKVFEKMAKWISNNITEVYIKALQALETIDEKKELFEIFFNEEVSTLAEVSNLYIGNVKKD